MSNKFLQCRILYHVLHFNYSHFCLSHRNDSGVINAFLTYFASDTGSHKGQAAEESQARDTSRQVIEECELDAVIDDTKFLRISSLQVTSNYSCACVHVVLLFPVRVSNLNVKPQCKTSSLCVQVFSCLGEHIRYAFVLF